MGGGLIQLTNTGAQDIYLTGNPQITYFKIVYRRHTNFAMESIEQVNTGTIIPGGEIIFNIARYGDLMYKCVVEIPVNGSTINENSPNNLGHAIFSNISIDIGGQRIDSHPSSYLEVYAELNEPLNDLVLAQNMENGSLTIFNSQFQYLACAGGVRNASSSGFSDQANYTWGDYTRDRKNLYVPLRFWFCNDIGQSIPLIALQYSEIFINMTFTNFPNQDIVNFAEIKKLQLYVDYIFLDTEERRRFAQISHEYLIDTIQFNDIEVSGENTFKLDMHNPVKEIIWCGADKNIDLWGTNGSFTNVSPKDTKWKILLNSNSRMPERYIDYYTNYQPYAYHTNRATQLTNGSDTNAIAVYSFALKPTEHQPSGTCNFSLIDNISLVKDSTNDEDAKYYYVFAVTYNILRIMSGTAGLAYNN